MAIRELKNNGGYFLNESEKAKVESLISPIRGKLNPAIVGRSAEKIAEMAEIDVPEGTRLLIAEEDRIGKEIPFSIEKLSPIFALYTASHVDEGIRICLALLDIGGRGHSLSLHTNDETIAQRFGLEMPVSRILVNTLASIGAAGATTGLTASLTLGCGSYGGNITADNITARHLINIKRIAYGIKNVSIPKPAPTIKVRVEENSTNVSMEKIIVEVLKEVERNEGTMNPDLVTELVKTVINQYQNQ
jgi:acyl-CoA reductase-like NAD-dependent aldehyde dehydrogenase